MRLESRMLRLCAFRVTVVGAVALTAWVKSSSVVLAGQTPGVARASAVGAAQATPSAPAQTQGRGGRRGGGLISFEDRNGFRQIFNGTSLDGWDGDSTFWRVENGAIVGESTAEKPVTENTFLIWSGGEPADFDLKLEFRISSTNSGIQYRSERLPEGGAEKVGKWVLKGYQADIDFNNQYTGMLYEERGRAFRHAARSAMPGLPRAQPADRAANSVLLKAVMRFAPTSSRMTGISSRSSPAATF